MRFLLSLKQKCRSLSDKLVVDVRRLLTRQCEFVAAQRLRRACQVCSLYGRLYGEATIRSMVNRFEFGYGSRFRWHRKPLGMLLGASFFSWDEKKITEDEMRRCADDLKDGGTDGNNGIKLCSHVSRPGNDWELVIDQEHLKVWRKPAGGYLYEYKVYGSFFDIPAKAFFNVQLDIEYRKKWDRLVIALDVVDSDERTGCEVIHWIMHYPFPMYSRDYVYIRRHYIDPVKGALVLVSKATEHPSCPVSDRFVRVERYSSSMVVKPHGLLDQNGFDYVLTYFDDPQAAFPGSAYSWMASSGVPDFVEKLHCAAIHLHQERPLLGPQPDLHQCQAKVVSGSSATQMPFFA